MRKLLLIMTAALLALSLSIGNVSTVSAGTSKSHKNYSSSSKKSKTKKNTYSNSSKKNSKSSTYSNKKNSTKKSGGKSSYKKSASKKSKEAEWPDCDDYETEDDFLDDWDGNIPDGSEAEDYWDNW